MREQGQKLILRRIRQDQFLAQAHVARLVFHQEEHALHGLLGILQAEQIHVDEIGDARRDRRAVVRRAERASRRKALSRSPRAARCSPPRRWRRSYPFSGGRFQTAAPFPRKLRSPGRNCRVSGSTSAMPLGILARILSLKMTSRSIRAPLPLAPVKFPGQPGDDSRPDDQPGREHSHSFEQIADRFVGDSARLLDQGDPAGRFDRARRSKVSSLLDVSRSYRRECR